MEEAIFLFSFGKGVLWKSCFISVQRGGSPGRGGEGGKGVRGGKKGKKGGRKKETKTKIIPRRPNCLGSTQKRSEKARSSGVLEYGTFVKFLKAVLNFSPKCLSSMAQFIVFRASKMRRMRWLDEGGQGVVLGKLTG